jgi:hypothetical protein
METCKLNINTSKVKNIILFTLLFFSVGFAEAQSQSDDPKVLINDINRGSITRNDLIYQEKIVCSAKDIIILGFTMSYPIGEDDFVELVSASDKLTQEMKDHVKDLKPGTEISFENIKAKKGDKTIILEAITLKIRE